jgi:hypothetical protein
LLTNEHSTEPKSPIALYRKKPVVIEAAVYAPGMEDRFKTKDDNPNIAPDARVPYIHTLEGDHYIEPGDYIITGIKGGKVFLQAGYFRGYIRASSAVQAETR